MARARSRHYFGRRLGWTAFWATVAVAEQEARGDDRAQREGEPGDDEASVDLGCDRSWDGHRGFGGHRARRARPAKSYACSPNNFLMALVSKESLTGVEVPCALI